MSSIGSPILTSLIQTAQAQRQATAARDKEKAEANRDGDRADVFELRVDGMATDDGVRKLPKNDSEEADEERDRRKRRDPRMIGPPTYDQTAGAGGATGDDPDEPGQRVDLQA